MKTIETTVDTFDELSDKAKEKAREWYREGTADDPYWYENVIDDAKTQLGTMGFLVKDIRFSGFSSQGDGASFIGTYHYAKGSAEAMATECPQDKELQRISRELTALQRCYFYKLSADITPNHYCHYVHERSTSIDVEHADGGDVSTDDVEAFRELVVDLNHWIYRQLKAEWDYQNSHDVVDEHIRCNEYTFTESGKRFG